MQYLVKLFGFKTHYVIFGNPKSMSYHTNYETLDSDDESNSLSSLNRVKKDVETGSKEQENKREELQDIQIEHKEPLGEELRSFLDAVKNNKKPVITGEDGYNALKMVIAANLSSKNNQPVSFEDIEK